MIINEDNELIHKMNTHFFLTSLSSRLFLILISFFLISCSHIFRSRKVFLVSSELSRSAFCRSSWFAGLIVAEFNKTSLWYYKLKLQYCNCTQNKSQRTNGNETTVKCFCFFFCFRRHTNRGNPLRQMSPIKLAGEPTPLVRKIVQQKILYMFKKSNFILNKHNRPIHEFFFVLN